MARLTKPIIVAVKERPLRNWLPLKATARLIKANINNQPEYAYSC
jgi:hypothetical protein